MIELTYAKRYDQYKDGGWGIMVQLVRNEFKWTRKEGTQMAGTWEGKKPTSGIYLFMNNTSAKFFNQKTNVMQGLQFPMVVTFQSDGTWDAVDLWFNLKHPGIGAANGGGGVAETHPIKDSAEYTLNVYTKNILTPKWDVNLDLNYIAVPERFLGVQFTLNSVEDKNGYATCFGGYFFSGKPVINPSAINGGASYLLDFMAIKGQGMTYPGALERKTMAIGTIKKADGKDYWNVLASTTEGTRKNNSALVEGNRKGITTMAGDGTLSNKFDIEGDVILDWDGSGIPVLDAVPDLQGFQIDQALDPRRGLRIVKNSTNPYLVFGYHVTEVDLYNQKTTLEALKLSQ